MFLSALALSSALAAPAAVTLSMPVHPERLAQVNRSGPVTVRVNRPPHRSATRRLQITIQLGIRTPLRLGAALSRAAPTSNPAGWGIGSG